MAKKETVKNIGIKVKLPEESCTDKNCPYHGSLRVRGKTFEGIVVSDRMKLSVSVEWPRQVFIKKYERYMKKRSKIKVHNPPCINAKQGDKVRVAECRKISKTKSFVVLEVLE